MTTLPVRIGKAAGLVIGFWLILLLFGLLALATKWIWTGLF